MALAAGVRNSEIPKEQTMPRWLAAIAADTRLSANAKHLAHVLYALGGGADVSPTAPQLLHFTGFRSNDRLIDARKELECVGKLATVRGRSRRILAYRLVGQEGAP